MTTHKTLDGTSIRLLRLSLWLGASEARSEPYIRYVERALELATPAEAKNAGRVISYADEQAGVAQKSHHIVVDARIRRSSTGRYVDRLLEHLQNIDKTNKYTVLVQPDDPWLPRVPNFARVFCQFSQFSFNPLDQIRFPRLLRSLKPDLVHFPMNQQPLFYNGTVITTTMDLTMLRFTRAGRTPLPVFWLKMAGYRLLFWQSNKKSKAIITISNFVKDNLAKKYQFTKDKTTTTHCASEPPLDSPAIRPTNIADGPFILFVGTAFPHKNLDRLVSAFELLLPYHPELRLYFAGKKEYYYQELDKRIAASPASSRIKTLGFVPDGELKWLYQNARAYVFPSLSEGFGLPGLEAMVHNCPVVSSDASCLPEVYGDAALYFNPTDPQDMASKIKTVLDNPGQADSLRQKGQEQVKKYSWRQMAKQTLAVYNSVLNR